jgi:hypothetical protein
MLVTLPLMFQLGGFSETWEYYPRAMRPVLSRAYDLLVMGVGLPALLAFLYFFPSGRLAPRWLGWAGGGLMAALYLGLGLAQLELLPLSEDLTFTIWFCGVCALLGLGLAGQVYRYRRVSTPLERRQTGLVVAGLFAAIGRLFLEALGVAREPPLALASMALQWVALVSLPLSIGVAILRYGLWEIDVLIRRTLIYSVLTGVLALAYFGLVVVLQSAVRLLTGQSQNALVTVTSTLVIAALFGPLRRRVQTAVDRRFYRRKYDAAKIVAAFGDALRHEHALDQVTAKLEYVTTATVQPSQVSVWLPPRPLRPGPAASERPELTVL